MGRIALAALLLNEVRGLVVAATVLMAWKGWG